MKMAIEEAGGERLVPFGGRRAPEQVNMIGEGPQGDPPVIATTTLFDMVQQVFALNNRRAISYNLSGKAYITGMFGGAVPFEKAGSLQLAPGEAPGANALVPL